MKRNRARGGRGRTDGRRDREYRVRDHRGGGRRPTGPGPVPGTGTRWTRAGPSGTTRPARAETLAPFAAQVHNGHILNQTVWNWYFDAGTDELNSAGMAKLDSIAQTRPAPDPRLYLQVARDVVVTPDKVDDAARLRDDLTAKRAEAVQKYMAQQPAVRPVAYELFVHDPAPVGLNAEFAASSYRGQRLGYVGGLQNTSGGAGAIGTGGGGGGSASGYGGSSALPAPAAPAPGTNAGGVGPGGAGPGY